MPGKPLNDGFSSCRASATTELTGSFRMSGLKTATSYAKAGDRIEYAIRVQNMSPHLLDQIVITDPLGLPGGSGRRPAPAEATAY